MNKLIEFGQKIEAIGHAIGFIIFVTLIAISIVVGIIYLIKK